VAILDRDKSSGEQLSSKVLPEESVGDDSPDSFLAALPRISSAISAADFLVDLSSSEDRLEDMMVSSVPIALLLLLAPLRRFLCRFMFRSSSEVTACRVGPWFSWTRDVLGRKEEPDP
jgi:hypothetical protein